MATLFLRYTSLLLALVGASQVVAAAPKQVDISSVIARSSNLSNAKTNLDSLVGSDANPPAVIRQLDQLASEAKRMAGPSAGFREKMAAVRRVIY